MTLRDRATELQELTGGSTSTGWMCDAVAEFVAALVRLHRPELVIQTGHLWGKSALYILDALGAEFSTSLTGDNKFDKFVWEHAPKNRPGHLYSIDPNPLGVPEPMACIDYFKKHFPDRRWKIVSEKSADFFRGFSTDATRIMGVVDGDHSEEGCRMDLEGLARLGASVIVVDDTLWLPHLLRVARTFAVARGYELVNHAVYNGVAVLTR